MANNQKQLICKLSKKDIDRYIVEPQSSFYLTSIFKSGNYFMPYYHLDVDMITINYNIAEKKDIYVDLTKLLRNRILLGEGIAVGTNVTNISGITDLSSAKFKLRTNQFEFYCRFKKYEEVPLFLTCESSYKIGEYPFGVIREKIIVKDANPRYNFIIMPKNISEIIETLNESGADLRYFYPHTFDFVSQNPIVVFFNGGYGFIQNANGLSFGTINKTLNCINDANFKMCTIDKSYFKGKTNGEYSLYRINSLNEKEKVYEIFPAKVILTPEKKDDEDDASNSHSHNRISKGFILLLLILVI